MSKRAFTLIEILVVLGVLGLALLFLQPNAVRARGEAETALVRQRAAALEVALAQWVGVVGEPAAAAQWQATPTAAGRYALVRDQLVWPPATLGAYVGPGYALQWGNTVLDRVRVTRDDGQVVYP